MKYNKWYIKEQCEKIRDDVELLKESPGHKLGMNLLLNRIVTSSYKIEADILEKDVAELIK